MATFPGTGANPLGFKVELNLASVWTDITQYVQRRSDVQISGMGRADETTSISASQLTLTLRNDGRFSPKLASGAYYPNIVRNCQIRISVNATSATSVAYSGFRFFGEVSSWPPAADVSGRDTYVQVTASGIWRRVSQSSVTIGSPYSRYLENLTGTSVPASAWMMEDGNNSTTFVTTVGAGAAGTISGTPSFAADTTSFTGCDALPQFNQARLTFNVSSGATPTNNVVRFGLSVPAAGDSQASTFSGGAELCKVLSPSGTVKRYDISLVGNQLQLHGYTSTGGGSSVLSGTITTKVNGTPVLVSLEITPSGSSINWALKIIKPGAGSVLDSISGTRASSTIAAVSQVFLDGQGRCADSACGALAVFYAVPSLTTAASAISGYTGEFAVDRFNRLLGEFGIAAEVIGSASAAMGPQPDDTLAAVLQQLEDTDGGLLYESRTQFGLGYRTLGSLQNQAVAATLSYASGSAPGPAPAPTYDDQLIRNSWLVTNTDGYVALAQLTSGAVSIQQVPNGVGVYSGTANTNASSHTQVNTIAQQKLFEGTVDDVRYPVVEVNLAGPHAAALFSAVPSLRIGDYFQLANLPVGLGGTGGTGGNQTNSVTSPTVFDTFLILSGLPAGTYSVAWTVTLSGTLSSADANNFELMYGPPSGPHIAVAQSVNTGSAGSYVQAAQTVTLTAANPALVVKSWSSTPTTGSTYQATVTATPAPSKQLAWGYSETVGTNAWSVSFNAIPEAPFETTFSPGVFSVTQAPTAGVAQGSSVGSSSSISASQIGGAAALPATISARTIGGMTSFISASTPYDWTFAVSGTPADNSYFICTEDQALPIAAGDTFSNTSGLGGPFTVTSVDPPSGGNVTVHYTPDASSVMSVGTVQGGKNGDTWVNTSGGNQVNIWANGAWSPVSWNAASVLTASSITASLIAAGTVIAGAVDGTTITGATIIADGTSGEILVYSGTPATGNLIGSWSGAAGTDSVSNAFPAGLAVEQGGLVLLNQSSAPATVSGASSFYSSTRGRPGFLSQSGDISFLERSTVNVAQWTVGNTTTPTNISAPLSYLGGEGAQSSEYEIEITGNGTGATQTLTFQLYLDGSSWGSGFTLGATVFTNASGTSFAFCVRMLIDLLGSGVSGTAISSSRADFKFGGNVQGGNVANWSSWDAADMASTANTIDTTANHTFQIKANWGATATGQTLTAYRTKIARRM